MKKLFVLKKTIVLKLIKVLIIKFLLVNWY